uniref:NADH-ubiquinone oxidoreductase chain 4 n=1 Tax=Xiphinema rivesi TaxID=70223 RepID=A0A1P8C790_9BILA|nr:NADH dehydrogenase subunit 4 [Xiphinema rivesi]AOT84263.1 NADH dehydrogenase subunit 4 [Xiphinema rivesi]
MMFWMVLFSILVIRLNDYSIAMSIGLLDLFSAFMVWLAVGSVILAYFSSRSFSILWGMLMVFCMSTFLVSNLFWFYLMFELSLLPIFMMILLWGGQPERLGASMYFIVYTIIFSVPFLVMIMSIGIIYFWWPLYSMPSLLVSMVFILPFLVKLPVFGLHFWLPKAHVEASTSGSMILASLLLKLGSFGLFRILLVMALGVFPMLMFVCAIISSIFTVMQVDFKKLVAYSSVTHMTFLSMASMTVNKSVLFMMIMFSVAHGWASSSLFFLVGQSSGVSYSRLGMLLSSMSNLFWFYLMFGLILMSNSSIPPMPSFFPEVLAICGALMSISVVIVCFIFFSLLVCYFNSILFLGISKSKGNHFKGGILSISESIVIFTQVALSIISIMLIFQF